MTDKEKLKKIKELADKMYSRMVYLTSDTRPIREAMEEYHKFIVHEYNEKEPVSEQKLSNVGRIGKNWKEPVSEDLEEAAVDYGNRSTFTDVDPFNWILEIAFKDGACWQKQQMMKDAIERKVQIDAGGYPYINCSIELYDYDKDVPLAKAGDKVKVITILEE